jgi:hypothetical protein
MIQLFQGDGSLQLYPNLYFFPYLWVYLPTIGVIIIITWGKKEVFRKERGQDGAYLCPIFGSIDESGGHVMYKCVELSELENELH